MSGTQQSEDWAARFAALEAGQRALERRVQELERRLAAAPPEPEKQPAFYTPEDVVCEEREGDITLTRHEGGGVALSYSSRPLRYATVFLDPSSQPTNVFIGLVAEGELKRAAEASCSVEGSAGASSVSRESSARAEAAKPGYAPIQLAKIAVFNVLGKVRTPDSPWADLDAGIAELLRGACRFDLEVGPGSLTCTVDKGRCVTIFSGLPQASGARLVLGIYGTGSLLIKYAIA